MLVKRNRKAIISETDGFSVLKVNNWYFNKLGIIQSYIKAYSTRFDLRNKTKMLLYIGAGPGMVTSDNNTKARYGTPLSLLSSTQFQRYIFCDNNPDYINALKVRVGHTHPKKQVIFLEGDINQSIEKLPPYLPDKTSGNETSILCIVDLQSFDINFETIEILADMNVDFILINSFIHSKYYSYKFYLDDERETMNAYFGSSWARLAELTELDSDVAFFMLVVKAYMEQIKQLGYNVSGTLHKYGIEDSLVPYYQIAYCTKSRALNAIKQLAVKDVSRQTELFSEVSASD